MYGTVLKVQSNLNIPLGPGTLSWSFQPVGGGLRVNVSTTLTNINNRLSYILRTYESPWSKDAINFSEGIYETEQFTSGRGATWP